MISENAYVTLPTITLRHRGFGVRIDTGELLFPAIVLVFCVAYYVETRGLPAQSMLYAAPLLYATMLLAVITIFGHAISVSTGTEKDPNGPSTESTGLVVWGVESTVVEEKHPQKDTRPGETDTGEKTPESGEDTAKSFFNVRSAIGLVLLTAGYIFSLYLVPFIVATAPFLAMTVYVFGERNYVRILVYSVGFTVLLWFVFINWLQVPLP